MIKSFWFCFFWRFISWIKETKYLKVEETIPAETDENEEYVLKLTNNEVKLMFRNMVHNWFDDDNTNYNPFIRALLAGNLREMNYYMNDIALKTFSF